MENEAQDGIIRTYQQLLANAQHSAITAQVQLDIANRDLQAAKARITELETPPPTEAEAE